MSNIVVSFVWWSTVSRETPGTVILEILVRPNKKRSLLRLTWLKFLRAGGRFFFLLKIFTRKSGMPTSTFQDSAGNSDSVQVPRCQKTSLPESPGRACVLDGWPRTSSNPLSRASSARALPRGLIVFDEDVKKGLLLLRQVSGLKMRSVEFKDSLSASATRNTESNVASSSTCRKRPLQKGFLSVGKLTDTVTGIAVDEKQLMSWVRTNRPKK